MEGNNLPVNPNGAEPDRRGFLSRLSTIAMAGGMLASYGTLAYFAGKFLYPSQGRKLAWMFVAQADKLKVNDTLQFTTPAGQTVTITRQGSAGTAEDFLALSTTCPHLGCRVHWEAQNNRFFCPCHNGTFDSSGKATAGPPADVNPPQSLPQFPLKLENGLIFIEVPTDVLG
jgi:Rieske Fe-S protein